MDYDRPESREDRPQSEFLVSYLRWTDGVEVKAMYRAASEYDATRKVTSRGHRVLSCRKTSND